MHLRSNFDQKYNNYYNNLSLNTETGPYPLVRENYTRGNIVNRGSAGKSSNRGGGGGAVEV